MLKDLAASPSALTYLVAIFGYSAHLAETFLAEPALPTQLARDRPRTHAPAGLESALVLTQRRAGFLGEIFQSAGGLFYQRLDFAPQFRVFAAAVCD